MDTLVGLDNSVLYWAISSIVNNNRMYLLMTRVSRAAISLNGLTIFFMVSALSMPIAGNLNSPDARIHLLITKIVIGAFILGGILCILFLRYGSCVHSALLFRLFLSLVLIINISLGLLIVFLIALALHDCLLAPDDQLLSNIIFILMVASIPIISPFLAIYSSLKQYQKAG